MAKAINKNGAYEHTAYAVGTKQDSREETDDELVPDEEWQGAAGIKVPKNVPPAMAATLRRIHQNLGHPSNLDLVRHLRLTGASEVAVKGAEKLRCETCCRMKRPVNQRPAKIVLPMGFNDEIAVDMFYLYDIDGLKHTALSVMDMASGYHVCMRAGCLRTWRRRCDNYGMNGPEPKRLVCDQEQGFQKDFVDAMELRGVQVKHIPGQAHWQLGSLERQQGWIRSMWDKVVEHESVN